MAPETRIIVATQRAQAVVEPTVQCQGVGNICPPHPYRVARDKPLTGDRRSLGEETASPRRRFLDATTKSCNPTHPYDAGRVDRSRVEIPSDMDLGMKSGSR